MTKFDDIYDTAIENLGLITSVQARRIGVSNNELVQYARRGKLERVGQGVYRLVRREPTPYDPYAEAVAMVGDGAYLCGESVLAMLELAPTNPSVVHVATPKRVRRTLPSWLTAERIPESPGHTVIEGVPCQTVADAIRHSKGKLMSERIADALDKALKQGWLTERQANELKEELS